MNKASDKDSTIPLLRLKGNLEENFYQLGMKDREFFYPSFEHIHTILRLSSPTGPSLVNAGVASIDFIIQEALKQFVSYKFLNKSKNKQIIEPYADGLGRPLNEVAYTFLIPELMSCMGKWLPQWNMPLWGCSTYFFRDQQGSLIHGRILDFPLIGSFDQQERAMLYQFDQGVKIFAYNSVGFPYPSLTAMTDQGVGFSLHQKFTPFFDAQGTPIFELIFQLLQETRDLASALKFLKHARSLTTWGFYLSFPDGQILVADIQGKKVDHQVLTLKPGELLYYNNQIMKGIKTEASCPIPLGVNTYNKMREQEAQNALAHFDPKTATEQQFLQLMSTPNFFYGSGQKNKSPSNWQLSPFTPTSLSISTLNPSEGRSMMIPGEAPKLYQGKVTEFSDVWHKPQTKNKHSTCTKPELRADYQQGFRALGLAQKAFDYKDPHGVYHHLQMAVEYLKPFPEQQLAKFYFAVARFMFQAEPRELVAQLQCFRDLAGQLPAYLNDHCLLFCSRLERILNTQLLVTSDQIQTPELVKLWHLEQKIPSTLLHKVLSKLIAPRIEILDVMYLHQKVAA